MKKYFLVALCAVLFLAVSGCGSSKNQVSCTRSETEDGITMSLTINADLDSNNKITGGSYVINISDKTLAETYCNLYKESSKSVTCSGNKITMNGLDSMDDETNDSEKIVGKTKDEFIEMAKADGYTCK